MKPGDTFNPRFEACGFHPEEIVARRRHLTDGQKWLYDRLVRWARACDGQRPNERAGEVWRSHDNIAVELGKSAKQVGRDLAKLETERLISHRKRDGRKSNTYVFLFHEDFEQTPTSGQTKESGEFERTPMSPQTGFERTSAPSEKSGSAAPMETLNGHARPVRSDLNGHPRPSNQKVFNQKEHTLSAELGGLKEQPAASRTTASVTSLRKHETSPAAVWAPRATWPMGSWESLEEFNSWWSDLVWKHPNKSRNTAAKAKALELITTGQLARAQFEEGYAALRAANSERWAEQNGRFVPNLWQLLDDSLWKFAPHRVPVASEYPDAEAYLRRVENE